MSFLEKSLHFSVRIFPFFVLSILQNFPFSLTGVLDMLETFSPFFQVLFIITGNYP
jgi:hypothetical protein